MILAEIRNNRFTDNGLECLLKILGSKSLGSRGGMRKIDFSFNEITDEGVKFFVSNSCGHIVRCAKVVNFTGNNVVDQSLKLLYVV